MTTMKRTSVTVRDRTGDPWPREVSGCGIRMIKYNNTIYDKMVRDNSKEP